VAQVREISLHQRRGRTDDVPAETGGGRALDGEQMGGCGIRDIDSPKKENSFALVLLSS
jgi:hypothetical protein